MVKFNFFYITACDTVLLKESNIEYKLVNMVFRFTLVLLKESNIEY